MNALTNAEDQWRDGRLHWPGASFNNELAAGVLGGFAVVTYKGKEWNVKYQGVKTLITRNDVHGDGSTDPAASLEVVIVKSIAGHHQDLVREGVGGRARTAPRTASRRTASRPTPTRRRSRTPSARPASGTPSGPARQEGFRGKACQDSRRVAIVPAKDIDNEAFGGPMLLRVPPASLKELVKHATALDQQGLQYFGVVSKISFTSDSYPTLFLARCGC